MPVGRHLVENKKSWSNCTAWKRVYQAGTLSGNPIAMIAGLYLLKELKNNPSLYTELNDKNYLLTQWVRRSIDIFRQRLRDQPTGINDQRTFSAKSL
jgi:glutamate-1-semialdehyde aminotransferase